MDLWIDGKPLIFTGGYALSVNNPGPDPESGTTGNGEDSARADIQGSIVASRVSLSASPAGSPSLGSLSAALLILSRP